METYFEIEPCLCGRISDESGCTAIHGALTHWRLFSFPLFVSFFFFLDRFPYLPFTSTVAWPCLSFRRFFSIVALRRSDRSVSLVVVVCFFLADFRFFFVLAVLFALIAALSRIDRADRPGARRSSFVFCFFFPRARTQIKKVWRGGRRN